ncbi:InlB B-repeat-containing protein, partial [Rubritalea profundi]
PLTVVNGSGNGSYVPGTDVAITADPPAENYHFDKWISSDGKIISDLTASDNYSVPGYATTITATYAIDTYHLSFDQQGGEGGATTATATYGKAMPLATVPTRTGYLFRGYFSETFGEGTQYYTYQMQSANNWDVTADTVLYAHWSPFHSLIQEDFESPVVSSYAQGSFPDNGQWVISANGHGSNVLGLVNKDGNDFSAPDPNHQAFACRDSNTGITTAEGVIGSLEGGATYRITVDVVRDADGGRVFNPDTPYTIEFVALDSGAALDDLRPSIGVTLASYNGDAPLDRTFETVSFEFAADPDSHAAQIGKSLAVRLHGGSHSASYDNVIVEKISPPFKHQLNYDDNGADGGAIPVGITEFHPGEAVTVLGNTGSLSKDSFNFAGWNTAANGTGLAYTSDDTFYISNDTTLYAQWYNPTASTIQYTAGRGGSILGDTTQLILSGNNGTSVTAVPDLSHNFEQWSDGSTTATRQESSVSSNVTLNASFVIKTYTVNYHANDGSGSISEGKKTYEIDAELSDGSALTLSGYIFSGWATEIDGGGTAYAGRDVYATDADLNLYAQWLPSETLLTEGFESPVVSGWSTKTIPNNGNWISPTSPDGYGWNLHGLVNEDSGYFSNADVSNNQAYRMTYQNRSGMTSAVGAIEVLEEDTTYVVEFTAVEDSSNSGRKYNIQLIAFDEGADRSPTSTIPAGSHLLYEATGEISTGGGIDYVRFTFSSDANHAAMVGMDLGLRIRSTISQDMAIIDDVRISKILPDPNTYSDWIGGFSVGGLTNPDDDFDFDGVPNAMENYFGTAPDSFSAGLSTDSVTISDSTTTFAFTHPINDSPSSDLTAKYVWSKDLSAFYDGGATVSGTTVNFAQSTPSGGEVSVTATVTGTAQEKIFISIEVTQDP